MDVLITICARSGSKGLPGKNMRMLHGRPLCEWTMLQADAWALEHGGAVIVVSTDDPDIKRLALKHQLWTIDRPPELATDSAGKVQAIRHAWQVMERKIGRTFDCVLDLDVTNPLRRVEDIQAVYEKMCADPLSAFSVTRARRHPLFNMWPRLGDGVPRIYARQEVPQMYDLNCCIYGYSREFMLSGTISEPISGFQHPITDRSVIYIMPDWTAFDIDLALDFEIVEFLMEKYGYTTVG